MNRRKPIKSLSTKRAQEYAAYMKRKRVWIKGRRCAVFPIHMAEDIHHQRGKVGALLNDERFWIPVSRVGHMWIDCNRNQARETLAKLDYPDARQINLLCQVGEFNTVPR